jgi:simple sugar transport system permease protein
MQDLRRFSAKSLMRKTETYIFITLVALCLAIQFISGGLFFTANNMVDISRALVVPALFSLVSLMVVISGGFDLSFPAIAAFSYSCTALLYRDLIPEGNILLAFVISGAIGLCLGLLNGLIISNFRLPTMIVTLGTQTVFTGVLMGVMRMVEITTELSQAFRGLNESSLFEVFSDRGIRSTMPTTVLILIGMIAAVYFVLRYTMFGRALYAIGGNEASAERAGFNVKRIKLSLYGLVGLLSGMIGIVRISMSRQSIPTGLAGLEMTIIPAVILGGASIFGGEGSVGGTILAITLIITLQNSLVLLGISSYWKDFFTGLLILVGVAVSAFQVRKNKG